MWCIGKLNDEYIERMEDVLDVYERPYNKECPVVCVDKKPVALIGDSRKRLPSRPGDVLTKDYEYKRNGSVNVFCAVEPKVGKYVNTVTEKRCGIDFAKFLHSLAKKYSAAKKIVMVMDNLSTHKEKSLINYYGDVEGCKLWNKFEIHYTPKHASWLNRVQPMQDVVLRQLLACHTG